MAVAWDNRRLFMALGILFAVAGCSGSNESALNRGLGSADKADAEADAESDPETDADIPVEPGPSPEDDATIDPPEEDTGVDAGAPLDAGAEDVTDAGDPDVIVVVITADAGPEVDSTVVVEEVSCGNGRPDPGEECDEGANNSDTVADACRSQCRRASCGDGVVDRGEACDRGAANSDSEANACRRNCTAARCGDGVVDQNEQCDTGDARSNTVPGACRVDCRNARCGDGVRDSDEGCDDGNAVDTDACRNSCRTPGCGNMVLDPGEECDDGNTASGDGCQATCRRPTCGDRVRDPNEGCDDGNAIDNDGCRSNCQAGCASATSCSDGLFCNGAERCGADGLCAAGTPPGLSDGIDCTIDACDEGSDRVTHSASDARCAPTAPFCADARATTTTATCDAARGCVQRSTSSACGDQPSSCALRGDGSYTLTTYTPGCAEDDISCAPASPAARTCSAAAASCSVGRVFTGVAAATCDPGSETCGRSAPAIDDCSTRDATRCAADDTSFTRVRGTCALPGGCSSSTSTETCADPADACSAGRLRTFAPACDDAAGCQPARQIADTACPAGGPSCATDPNTGLASLTRFTPACASGSSCAPNGAASTPERCPSAAPSCAPNAQGVASVTSYAPACAGASSCASTGTPSAPVACGASATTCGASAPDGALAVQRFTPACDPSAPGRCREGGAPAARELCTARAAQCSETAFQVPSVVRYAPACSGASCVAGGTAQAPVACTATTAPSCVVVPGALPQETRYVPACNSNDATSCLAGGRAVTSTCSASAPRCLLDAADQNRAYVATYTAGCSGGLCIPGGREARSYCDVRPTACEGNVAVDYQNSCSGTACATVRTTCTTGRQTVCASQTRLEFRQNNGCVAGTGCSFQVVDTASCLAPYCETLDGILTGRLCGGCGVDANNNARCLECRACASGACNPTLNACQRLITLPVDPPIVDNFPPVGPF